MDIMESNMQWISIEEHLPTAGEDILFIEQYDDSEPSICFGYLGQDGKWYDKTNQDYDGADVATTAKVTHWMPLPEPPL